MIYIYKDFIKNNINNLTINHIKMFADKRNIIYTNDELTIIYNFIMNYYNDLLEGNIDKFSLLKDSISKPLYKNIIDLYYEYKNYL